ncbi:MAG: molybdopterin-dependent oxidoreductase, partial [Mailhella sp.]|nr:molybdopterin-dependent oxidoreductase [Mailhella sp.]
EHHPIAFKWIMKAKERGAALMHVDPKFSRTSARCDFHVPLRSGTDIAFLGGMIRYIFETDSWFKEYVVNYTNASFIVSKSFGFSDGLFTGYDPETRRYDKTSWRFERDSSGAPLRDDTLQHPRCVLNVLRKHFERYTLDSVSATTGVSKADLVRVYDIFCATGKPDKAGTMLYALGWTQHTVGVQNIRSAAIIQLLLGNIGVSGGGINALRGEPNVQGSTDHALLYDSIPGYHKAPVASWQTLADYNKANTPVSHVKGSVNWWQNRPKYVTSLLKAWYGDSATPENDFCYGLLPKLADVEDYSYMYIMDRVFEGKMRGGFIMGVNPMNSFPNTHKMRKALDNLDWLVVTEIHNSETSDNWRRPGADPAKIKTEVFLLPSAHRIEKEGTISNSGRWLQWFDKAVEPEGEARNFGNFWVPFINLMRKMYEEEGGACPEQLLKMRWYEKFDASDIAKRINGQFEADCEVNGKKYRKGQQVPMFTALKADGSTSSLNWLYAGSWTEEEGNKSKRRDPSQTPMQANIGIFPNWSWCWPQNRRILYNRASVDLNGRPWDPSRAVIEWKDGKWVGDTPDGAQPPMAESGVKPFIMT